MFDWVFTGFYRVLLGFTGFYWVFLSSSGLYRVFTGFQWLAADGTVLPAFTGFYRVWIDCSMAFGLFFCYYWAGRDSFTNDGRELIDPWFWPYVKLGNRGDFTGGRAGLWPCWPAGRLRFGGPFQFTACLLWSKCSAREYGPIMRCSLRLYQTIRSIESVFLFYIWLHADLLFPPFVLTIGEMVRLVVEWSS